jgi:hypothetical protein
MRVSYPPSRAGSTHAHPCHVCAPAPTAIWVFPPCPTAHAHLQPHAQARQLGKRCRRASASSDLSFAHLVCAHPFSQSQPRGGNLASSVDGLASFDLLRISCAHTPPHRHKPKRGNLASSIDGLASFDLLRISCVHRRKRGSLVSSADALAHPPTFRSLSSSNKLWRQTSHPSQLKII